MQEEAGGPWKENAEARHDVNKRFPSNLILEGLAGSPLCANLAVPCPLPGPPAEFCDPNRLKVANQYRHPTCEPERAIETHSRLPTGQKEYEATASPIINTLVLAIKRPLLLFPVPQDFPPKSAAARESAVESDFEKELRQYLYALSMPYGEQTHMLQLVRVCRDRGAQSWAEETGSLIDICRALSMEACVRLFTRLNARFRASSMYACAPTSSPQEACERGNCFSLPVFPILSLVGSC